MRRKQSEAISSGSDQMDRMAKKLWGCAAIRKTKRKQKKDFQHSHQLSYWEVSKTPNFVAAMEANWVDEEKVLNP